MQPFLLPLFHIKKIFILSVLSLTGFLAGCDYMGISNTTVLEEKLAQEGAAAGAGCRLEGQSLQVCYEKYPKMRRAHILQGWRDMNSYMRENNMNIMTEAPSNPEQTDAAAGTANPNAAEGATPSTDKPTPAAATNNPTQSQPSTPHSQNNATQSQPSATPNGTHQAVGASGDKLPI